MDKDQDYDDGLMGKMLIAMPGMGDERFDRTVIYMCAHSEDGALGLVINRRAEQVSQEELFKQLDITAVPEVNQRSIHYGGPVETGRGFVLHTADFHLSDSTLEVDDKLSMTASVEILQAIAKGEGPKDAMIALGYSGWAGGQLEGELQRNGWLTCDGDPDLIFGGNDEDKWTAALNKLGIDPSMLSSQGGMA
ncbi:MAG: YqgE/AlgH family protein [Pikeienuella sp.]